jgi:hypothetical protein
MRVEDIHHQGVICRTGPGAVERIFPAFATPAASFAIPQIAATYTYLPPRRAKVLRSCTKHFWGLGKEKQKRARWCQPRVINGKRIALDGL